jgi:iodotyrosine deiodinase
MPPSHVNLEFVPLPPEQMQQNAAAFLEKMRSRRSVREFSSQAVPLDIIQHAILTAGSAPNGANLQPWHFVVVQDQNTKKQIRQAAEAEEQEFYQQRAPAEWLQALAPLGTDAQKPFLETAPYLVAVFAQSYGQLPSGERVKHYYVQESVGIAVGLLIACLHHAGLACLTHTPSPMKFLNQILDRPENEKPYVLLVVGYPAPDCQVPVVAGQKKPLADIMTLV